MKDFDLLYMDMQLFANPNDYLNTTNSKDLTPEMKVFYSDYLIDNAVPKLVHNQFGQKHPIPKNGGKTIEFRRFSPYPKALVPLTEGVTPAGRNVKSTAITATIKQYGDYTVVTDILSMTAIDNVLSQVTKLHGNQAGETLDTITRDIINAGQNVQYGAETKTARYLLTGGSATKADNDYLTVDAVRRAVRALKNQKADKINGYYVGIIHPDVSYDLVNDPQWEAVKTYDPEDWYEGEIGRIAGVRFVETTEAKIFHAEDFTAASRTLSVKTAVTTNTEITVKEAITADEATALAGRKIIVGNVLGEIASATAGGAGSAKITLTAAVSATADSVLYPGEAGAGGRDVYSTLILGDNAYGVTEVSGGGLEHIFKPLGSAGAADPLNQRCTSGWKATQTAVILVDEFMRRIETASTFESGQN